MSRDPDPTASEQQPPRAPPRAQVEAQLEAVLASGSFAGARRSREFLRFVVDEALAGREHRLGGYTIGVEVFGRPQSFDPQTDPIVRVEAGRLRHRLEHHYLTEGSDAPVLIGIPKGGYVPRFSLRGAAPSEFGSGPAEASASPLPASGQWWRQAAKGAVVLLLLGSVGLGVWSLLRAPEPERSPPPPAPEPTRGLAILPFDYAADTDPHPFLDKGFVDELIATLAALPGLEVVALGSAEQAARDGLTPAQIGQALGVDYLVRGAIRQERERVRVTVTLVEVPSSRVFLSRRHEGTLDSVLDLQAGIARDIAQSLVPALPPSFERRLEAATDRDPEVLALYREANALLFPPSDPVRSGLAEEAYRRVIELDPDFADGHGGLARVLAFRSWWGLSEQPEADERLALEAARTAVEKDPESGRAQVTLAMALSIAGRHEEGLPAARRAPALSPSDPWVLAFSGLFQAYAGDMDAGIPLIESATRLDPLSVRTPFRNMAGQVLFHAGRFEEAHEVFLENVRLAGPDNPQMSYYRAATLARLGRAEDARRELEKAGTFPYESDIRDFLSTFRDPREADVLLDALGSLRVDPEATDSL